MPALFSSDGVGSVFVEIRGNFKPLIGWVLVQEIRGVKRVYDIRLIHEHLRI